LREVLGRMMGKGRRLEGLDFLRATHLYGKIEAAHHRRSMRLEEHKDDVYMGVLGTLDMIFMSERALENLKEKVMDTKQTEKLGMYY
jgi:hypothetical protein